MDRRSFIQTAGNVAALSVLHGAASVQRSGAPGRILAIAAHPGDGMFTMGASLAQQIERKVLDDRRLSARIGAKAGYPELENIGNQGPRCSGGHHAP